MKKKIYDESKLLFMSKELLSKLLTEYAKDNRNEIDRIKESKIKSIISRVFDGENEYLFECPEDYFDMYG